MKNLILISGMLCFYMGAVNAQNAGHTVVTTNSVGSKTISDNPENAVATKKSSEKKPPRGVRVSGKVPKLKKALLQDPKK